MLSADVLRRFHDNKQASSARVKLAASAPGTGEEATEHGGGHSSRSRSSVTPSGGERKQHTASDAATTAMDAMSSLPLPAAHSQHSRQAQQAQLAWLSSFTEDQCRHARDHFAFVQRNYPHSTLGAGKSFAFASECEWFLQEAGRVAAAAAKATAETTTPAQSRAGAFKSAPTTAASSSTGVVPMDSGDDDDDHHVTLSPQDKVYRIAEDVLLLLGDNGREGATDGVPRAVCDFLAHTPADSLGAIRQFLGVLLDSGAR